MKARLLLSILLCSLPFQVSAARDWPRHFRDENRALLTEARQLRQRLHRIPETCNCERQTAEVVAATLRGLGLEVTTGIAGTGIKAVLRGGRSGPVVGLRADMDALPITEATGLPFVSQNQGTMHACGHDVHMTNVLIAAKMLAAVRAELPGTVVFLFQPCEEGSTRGEVSGAAALIAAGALENPKIERMIGLHVMPDLPTGTVGLRAGPLMASVATVRIRLIGQSSHGALPHQGKDAIHAAAQAIVQFQPIISRIKDPGEKALITIGTIQGGVRQNVLAGEAVMTGTVRTFSDAVQDMIEQEMERVLQGIEWVYGVKHEFAFIRDCRFVKNDPGLVRRLTPVFQQILGPERVVEVAPSTVSEDFALYSHRLPSLFFFLGTGQGENPPPLHSPQFAPDENVLAFAPALLAAAAVDCLAR